ncbi:MAG TPA: DinB family protein [Bryobacteraceae bacterium]|nr:DinB family protein [Bryobacteraceae bacterium]
MPFSESLLPEFDEEMKNTRKLLECVPDGKFDYKPHPKSMSLAQLASHVAEMPSWTMFTLDREVLELTPDFKPEIAGTRTDLLRLFDKNVAEARMKILVASDEDWQKIWTFKYAGKTIMSMPRSTVMRSSIMNHLIHHRAQLGVYLRLNEVEFPGMYGPSADEMSAWQTQTA